MTDVIIDFIFRDENGNPFKYRDKSGDTYDILTLIGIAKSDIRKVYVQVNGRRLQVVPTKDNNRWILKVMESNTSKKLKLEDAVSDCPDSL